MESSRLKTKDIITVVLLSLINIVIFASGTFLYATPVTLLLMPLYYALLEGMVVFSIGFKVRKRGAMPMEMMNVKESESLKYVMTHAGKFIMSWGWMVLLVATALVAYIGSLLGKRVVRNHIRKAEGGYEDED